MNLRYINVVPILKTNVKKGFYKGIDNIFSETTSRSEDFDSLANNTALNTLEGREKYLERLRDWLRQAQRVVNIVKPWGLIKSIRRKKRYKYQSVKQKYEYIFDEDKLAEVVAKTLVKEGYEQKNGQSSEQVMNNQQEVSKSNSSMSDEEEVVDTCCSVISIV
uniref:Uncharacterized protein n=1 Tax=Rhizophagus irregularis (strain DAOM 181602 / DAOM 197198 / MUCL 43194) TaxID=747089 RepID=U9SJ45_RHIID